MAKFTKLYTWKDGAKAPSYFKLWVKAVKQMKRLTKAK